MSDIDGAKIPKGRIFPKNYWERPKVEDRKRGDPSEKDIYLAVGYALSAWESMEEIFASLFLTLSQAEDANSFTSVRRVFGSVESTSGRIRAVEAVASLYFFHYWHITEVSKPLNILLEEIKRASYRRNEIAHGKAVNMQVHTGQEKDQGSVTNFGCLLVAPDYITGRTDPYPNIIDGDFMGMTRSHYRFNHNDIILFGRKFFTLKNKILEYRITIEKDKETKIPKTIMGLMLADPIGFGRKMRR